MAGAICFARSGWSFHRDCRRKHFGAWWGYRGDHRCQHFSGHWNTSIQAIYWPRKASHVLEGTINKSDRTDVVAIHFSETPAHSSYDWRDDPEQQYVITLSGTLEFTPRDGEKFVLRPGDVLLAEDHIGTGHRWRLIDDQPWRRAYVVLKPGAKDSFVAKTSG